MTRSEMVDCGIDYDYEETIRMGDPYEWGDEDWEDDDDWDDDSDDCFTDCGFNPYLGAHDFDC